jgi:hypothetical protein
MKYKTVEILKNWHGKWWYKCYRIGNLDRVITNTKPNSIGFYHYPETKPDAEAFEELKRKMIERLQDEIKELNNEISTLEKLKFIQK